MQISSIPGLIAGELRVKTNQVEAVIQLLDQENTIPFIARYRKEATGELDEEQIRTIMERLQYLRNLVKRQQEILSSIEEQGKLTSALAEAVQNTVKLQELEDLYLPFRPKRRTRAQIAREKGLEPLAEIILAQKLTDADPLTISAPFVSEEKEVASAQDALNGALDIIAENISEQADIRALLRRQLWQNAEITTELAVSEAEGKEYITYKEYHEPIKRIPSHRILAINRGEKKEILKVHIQTSHETNIDGIKRKIVTGLSSFTECLNECIADSYKRLLLPAMERELRSLLTENAEKQAIRVFGLNLRQLLLLPPLANHIVMGLDPGLRTGCKMAVVNETGAVLETATLYMTASDAQRIKAEEIILQTIRKHSVSLVSIGNGTGSYETEEIIARLIHDNDLPIHYLIANEAGASVYSASKLAKDELPDLDVTLRGAVSIARRVQDPLSELVKIDPKSVGVGQYQHDVNQKELASTLDTVVESCVNHVGVDLNTASPALLTHVAGINSTVAKNIAGYRNVNGSFKNRRELMKVPRLGQAAFTQCAGFLRIRDQENPLDNTPVHPESYLLAAKILDHLHFSLSALRDKDRLKALQIAVHAVDPAQLARILEAGEPTVRDILAALIKPGRDPREDMPAPLTRKNIVKLTDLQPGAIMRGTVHNVTDFGVFVDIGIKTNGLIHRSELSYKPFRHPLDIVSVGDIVDCVILHVDEDRGRIGLSLKQAQKKADQ